MPRPPLGERGKSRLPVGGVCCSMAELGRLAAAHLPPGPAAGPRLLKPDTLRRLHEAQPPGESTMSWYRSGVDWARGLCLWHGGCDGHWFCLVHVLPDERYATCVATNYGGKDADRACQAAHLELVKRVPRVREKLRDERASPPGRLPRRP